jgi:hypothetical protein
MGARHTNYRRVREPPVRVIMLSIIPTELLWIAAGFIMLMAAFLAAAAE